MTNADNVHFLKDRVKLGEVQRLQQSLKFGDGDGTSGSMEAVDAKIAAAEARTDAKFAELRGDMHSQFGEIKTELARKPGTGMTIGIAIALFAAIVAAIAFGGDRFDAGLGMADARQSQLDRDAKQDSAVKSIEGKLDQLIAAQSPSSEPANGALEAEPK